MNLVSLLFSMKGRINRAQYWLTGIGAGFVGGLLWFCVGLFSGIGAPGASKDMAVAQAGAAIGMLLLMGAIMAALSWIQFALQVKRFHDRGRPGYFALAPLLPLTMIFVAVVSATVSGASPPQIFASVMLWVWVLGAINIWFFIDLGCLPSQSGPNKYGDPPGGGAFAPQPAAPAPSAPVPGYAAQTGAARASALESAQAAIDRAIAEKARATSRQAGPPLRPPPSFAAPAHAASFGRRVR